MAPHSSALAWTTPWTEKPGGLQSMGSRGVGHDWATSLSLFTFMPWRRKWQLTPVFLPGESQGWGSLMGCCLWDRTELDTTEATQQQQQDHTWGGHGYSLQYCCLENPHGQRTLAGCGPWGRKVSDMTEQLSTAQDHTNAMQSPGDTERNNLPSQSRTYTSEGRWACILGSGRWCETDSRHPGHHSFQSIPADQCDPHLTCITITWGTCALCTPWGLPQNLQEWRQNIRF